MERSDAINEINRQSPNAFLKPARKKGWICPDCANGSGKDGDGIVKNPRTGKYKCFKCGFSGDVIDLVGLEFGLSEFNDKLNRATEIYNIHIDSPNGKDNRLSVTRQEAAEVISQVAGSASSADTSEYIARCHADAAKTDYFSKRGIDAQSIKRFRLGYDEAYDEHNVGYKPWKAVIIPTSNDTFEARNTEVEPNSPENSRNKYRKHGNVKVFNISALSEQKDKPIFICEGIFDALSIIQCGGEAVGLGSAVNYKYLTAELEKVTPVQPLIIAFDADKTGEENAEKLAGDLQKLNIPYLCPKDFLGGFHDANDRLLHDPDGLKASVVRVYRDAAAMPSPKELAKNEYLKTSAGFSLRQFVNAILSNAQRPRLSTGFQTIDDALDGGIYTGLYIIGAISSLGKTTLSLQIADNLAKQGRDVLFFSLEQSRYDLMSKSVSRETFVYCQRNNINIGNAKSNLGVLDGRRWAYFNDCEKDVLNQALSIYGKYAKHIFIHEGIGNISVAEIREKLKAHISITGNKRPIVFIDYLQILKAAEGMERASDKQIVDRNVTALKQMSRDFDIPIIAVSSLNRQNYSERINMSAYKESGAIEYGSDVLIGLQLTGAGESGFDADTAKEKDPRHIDFCILKNRNGKIFIKGLPMLFYPKFNCFMSDDSQSGPDGFLPLDMFEDEDFCPFDNDY